MLILVGIVATLALIIFFALWVHENMRRNNSLSQQELNKNIVEMHLKRIK